MYCPRLIILNLSLAGIHSQLAMPLLQPVDTMAPPSLTCSQPVHGACTFPVIQSFFVKYK